MWQGPPPRKGQLPIPDACLRFRAARAGLDANGHHGFLIARCDSDIINDFEETVERCAAYIDAGADMLCVLWMHKIPSRTKKIEAMRNLPRRHLQLAAVAKVQIVHVVGGLAGVQLHADVPAPLPSLIAVVGHAAGTDNFAGDTLIFVIRHAYIGRVQPNQIHAAVPDFAAAAGVSVTAVGVAQLGAPRKNALHISSPLCAVCR
mgnify:CR=1 FL=1